MIKTRLKTGTTLYQHLEVLPSISEFSFFQWQLISSCEGWDYDNQLGGCSFVWYEVAEQNNFRVNRQDWLKCVCDSEERIADYLGYWPYKHIENEIHILSQWDSTLRTKWNKVIALGNRTYKPITYNSMTWTREVKFWSFGDVYQATFTNVTGIDSSCLESLEFIESGLDIKSGWSIRDYDIVSYDGSTLVVNFPLSVMGKAANYFGIPKKNQIVPSLDYCLDDSFISFLDIYQLNYTEPHGKARIYTQSFNYECCDNDPDCTVCNGEYVDICLVPLDSEQGLFKIVPVEYDELLACWIKKDFTDYCEPCQIYNPLQVEINYLSSCGGSLSDNCKPIKACGPCSNIINAIVYLAIVCTPIKGCDCVEDLFSHYQTTVLTGSKETRFGRITNEMLEFGGYIGSIEVYQLLKNHRYKRRDSVMSFTL